MIFLKLILMFTIVSVGIAQSTKTGPLLVDSVERPGGDHLLAILDALAVEVFNNSKSASMIVVLYGGLNPVENKFYERFVKSHLKKRRLDPARYTIATAIGNQKLRIDLWKSADGTKPTVTNKNFDYFLPKTGDPILFISESVEVVKIDGERTFLESCANSVCISILDTDLLSKFLEANPNYEARLEIYNKKKKHAEKLGQLIIDGRHGKAGIPLHRVKIEYGGRNFMSNSELTEMFDIKVWLIPRSNR